MNLAIEKIGSFILKNGQTVEAYNSCTLDGYSLYYQNESLAWKSCPLTDIQDFGGLLKLGSFPAMTYSV